MSQALIDRLAALGFEPEGPLYISLHTSDPRARVREGVDTYPWAISREPRPGLEEYTAAVRRTIDRLAQEAGIPSRMFTLSEGYPTAMMTTKLVLQIPDDRYGAVLEAVGRALNGPSHGTTASEHLLVEILDNTERLITMTEDLSTAEANLDAEVTQDLADKQALRDAVAALQAANTTLQSTNTADEAALADAKSQLDAAAGRVQAATDKLASSDTDLPPASPPADTTPPVEPTPVPVEPAPPVDVPVTEVPTPVSDVPPVAGV